MKFNTFGSIIAAATLAFTGIANAGVVYVASGSISPERTQLIATLEGFGLTVINGTSTTAGDLVISTTGASGSSPSAASVASGVNYIQLSDHGSDVITNTWSSVTEGALGTFHVDSAHAITAGLDSSWTETGFWAYGIPSTDFLGWSTDTALTSLVSESTLVGESRLVVANEIGAGRAVYVGFNSYGDNANANSIQLLCNAINWAGVSTSCAAAAPNTPVPTPGALLLLGLGLIGVGIKRRTA